VTALESPEHYGQLSRPVDTFVVDPLKTAPPPRRTGVVDRTGAIDLLRASVPHSLVLVIAPTGYGKTTTLAQWAETDGRDLAWLSLDDRDNDPVCFLRHLVLALDRHELLPDEAVQALTRSTPPIHTVVLPRLSSALFARRTPFVLVIDDVHVIRSADTLDCIRAVMRHLPAGSTLVLAGRSTPELPIGRLRLEQRVTELGPVELAMTENEADALLRAAGVELSPGELSDLFQQTEGWPAGLALAALAVRESHTPGQSVASFAGDHRLVAEYLHDELLATLPEDVSRFLTRASVLPRLSGPLCDAVLEITGSGQMLERLTRSKNLFVIPLDESGRWYRFHHLFADLLRAELHAQDPATERALHRRASALAEEQGDTDGAIRHAVAGGATRRAAHLVLSNCVRFSGRGRHATVELWLDLFDEAAVRAEPGLALAKALQLLGIGDIDVVEYWIDVSEEATRGLRAQHRQSMQVAVAAVRALTCAAGLGQMAAFTDVVRAAGRDDNPWWGLATMLQGVATLLMGDTDAARGLLREAESATTDLPQVHAVCLAQLALAATRVDDWPEATRLVGRSRQEIDENQLNEYVPVVPAYAISALVQAQAGDVDAARRDAQQARHLLSIHRNIVARTSLQAYCLLARADLLIGDPVAARTMADEAALVLPDEPLAVMAVEDLRHVQDALAPLESQLSESPEMSPSSLTTAELRVLEFLPTHLSLKEIGDKLFVSRNTVKSQAIATYRKLGVSSRGEAVTTARALGLIEA